MKINPFKIQKKDKLLYYFYQIKKIKESELNKSKLSKTLGYKSIGHFYRDFQSLIEQGLIEITNQNHEKIYRITRKGEQAFIWLKSLKLLSYLILYSGFVFIFQSILMILDLPQNPLAFIAAGMSLILVGIFALNFIVRRVEQRLKYNSQQEKAKLSYIE